MDYKKAMECLNLNAEYTEEELKKQYKLLARKYHPDNTATADEKMFMMIKEAFEFLSSSDKAAAPSASVCPMCGGTGQRREKVKTARGFMARKVACRYCNGTGSK